MFVFDSDKLKYLIQELKEKFVSQTDFDIFTKDVAKINDSVINNSNTWSSEKINGLFTNYATKDDLHSHSNKSVLDGITSAKVTAWDNKLSSIPNEYVTESELTAKGYATEEYVDDNEIVTTFYGTSESLATESEKVITVDDSKFTLRVGTLISVKFSVSNTASNVTLNVNGTGAYPIWYNTAEYTANSTTVIGSAGLYITYMFNGTHWVWVSRGTYSSTTNASLGHGYGVCDTAETTLAKACTISSYTLTTGGSVSIKFTNAVPANSTLNIRTRGAKKIFYKGSAITDGVIEAGDTATFVYDGTQYQLISIDRDYATKEYIDEAIESIDVTNQLTNYALKTELPTKTSQLTNDSGYLTSIPSDYVTDEELSSKNYATKTYVDGKLTSSSSSDSSIPSYARSEMQTIVDEIIEITGENTSPKVPFTIAFLTDLHYSEANSTAFSSANGALKVLDEYGLLDCAVFGGDYIANWSYKTKENAKEQIMNCRKAFADLPVPSMWLQGNHENNGYWLETEGVDQRITKAELFTRVGRAQQNEFNYYTNSSDPFGNYGYIDFDNSKVRVIGLNTSDIGDFDNKYHTAGANSTCPLINIYNISATQVQWLCDNALNFEDKKDTSDWNIIFVSHVPIYSTLGYVINGYTNTFTSQSGKTYNCSFKGLDDMIVAYQNGGNFTFSSNGVTATSNFANKERANILCFVNGHNHRISTSFKNGIPYIQCPNFCKGAKECDNGNTYAKGTSGTARECSFTILTCDTANNKIYAYCYGAGYDRIIDVATGTTTNVYPGADDGSTDVFNGNLISTYGYDNTSRLSLTDGGLKNQTGSVTTGFIPVKNGYTIRIKGLTFPTTSDGLHTICLYDGDKGHLGNTVSKYLYQGSTPPTGMSITISDDLVTIVVNNAISNVGCEYIKVCGTAEDGSKMIITINQEITQDMIDDVNNGNTGGGSTPDTPTLTPEDITSEVGYTNGVRLSTSSGNNSSRTGSVATGFIKINAGDVIRIKGLTFPTSQDGNHACCQYNTNQTYLSKYQYLHTGTVESGQTILVGITFTISGDLITLTVNDAISTIGCKYIRVAGTCEDGANLKITRNMEIGDTPTEPDTPSISDGDITSEVGYTLNKRYSTSGGVIKDANTGSGHVTLILDKIQIEGGDTIRVKGLTYPNNAGDPCIILYNEDGETYVNGRNLCHSNNGLEVANGSGVSFTIVDDLLTVTHSKTAKYVIGIGGYCDVTPIAYTVTRNMEIK